MNRFPFVFLLAAGLFGPVTSWAQTCPQGQGQGQELSQAQISTLLSGRYAYGTQYDGKYYNLLHATGGAGPITDYKRGPNHPMDKSSVVGSYSIGTAAGRDVVTYTYGTSSYSYSISPRPTGQNPPGPGTYVFCQRAGSAPNNVGQALSVTISNTNGPVQP